MITLKDFRKICSYFEVYSVKRTNNGGYVTIEEGKPYYLDDDSNSHIDKVFEDCEIVDVYCYSDTTQVVVAIPDRNMIMSNIGKLTSKILRGYGTLEDEEELIFWNDLLDDFPKDKER